MASDGCGTLRALGKATAELLLIVFGVPIAPFVGERGGARAGHAERLRFSARSRRIYPLTPCSSEPSSRPIDTSSSLGRILGRIVALVLAAGCGGEGVVDPGTPDAEAPGPDFPRLTWPMSGIGGSDWVINNYVDLDPSSGLRDYRGGAKVYDGHRGTDIDVPNFRWMDDGFPILAAAPGTVTNLHDGEFDRNVSCSGQWNFVEVTHADGSRALYGHLRRESVAVVVGAAVTTGQTLGVVGSSGCSTAPHLHFELLTASGTVVDPFERGLWVDPPPYETPLTFMDLMLKSGAIGGVDEIKDPPPNLTAASLGTQLGIGLSMAGGGPGDVVAVTLRDAAGALRRDPSVTFDRIWRHTYWYFNTTNVTGASGTWTLTVLTSGTPAATYEFTLH